MCVCIVVIIIHIQFGDLHFNLMLFHIHISIFLNNSFICIILNVYIIFLWVAIIFHYLSLRLFTIFAIIFGIQWILLYITFLFCGFITVNSQKYNLQVKQYKPFSSLVIVVVVVKYLIISVCLLVKLSLCLNSIIICIYYKPEWFYCCLLGLGIHESDSSNIRT